MEQLVGRQGQPRGAQVHAIYLSEQKGWSQEPPLPSPHLRVGSGDGNISAGDCCVPEDLAGLLKVSSFFVLFLHMLLCQSRSLLAVAWDLAAISLCYIVLRSNIHVAEMLIANE